MPFVPSIPQATDNLNVSQGDLLANNGFLDTSFGVDHYKFSDATPSNGFHNQMTTPIIGGSAHPATTANYARMYAMQDSANIGLLNYSRGPNSAVPTPITSLHSTAAAITVGSGASTTVLDFNGVNFAFGTIYVYALYNGVVPGSVAVPFTFNNAFAPQKFIGFPSNNTIFQINATGTVLSIKNTGNPANDITVYWTLEFERIQ